MLNFIYWNIYQQGEKLHGIISQLALEKAIDVLIIAEICSPRQKTNVMQVVQKIESTSNLTYLIGSNPEDAWLHVFFKKSVDLSIELISNYSEKFDPKDLADKPVNESNYFAEYLKKFERMLFYKITVKSFKFLLVPLHFPSRMYCTPNKQKDLAVHFKNYINIMEQTEQLKSIVLGDFNMCPFEIGMVHHEGFFAVPSEELTKDHNFYNIPYTAFYNPCWSKFGDYQILSSSHKKRKPAGSYFSAQSSDVNHYWYLLDQVILRKDLINKFNFPNFEYVTGYNGRDQFLREDLTPNKEDYSDHLPIYFQLNNF